MNDQPQILDEKYHGLRLRNSSFHNSRLHVTLGSINDIVQNTETSNLNNSLGNLSLVDMTLYCTYSGIKQLSYEEDRLISKHSHLIQKMSLWRNDEIEIENDTNPLLSLKLSCISIDDIVVYAYKKNGDRITVTNISIESSTNSNNDVDCIICNYNELYPNNHLKLRQIKNDSDFEFVIDVETDVDEDETYTLGVLCNITTKITYLGEMTGTNNNITINKI